MVNGLLLVKKPTGITSHQLVAQARRILNTPEVGHAGTLDPLATGLMILLIGEATKLSDYVLNGDKAYRVQVRLGLTTDTLDITGKTTCEAPVTSTAAEISAAIATLEGEFLWPIPMFSAAKTDGRKLYELARENKVIETPVKKMKFWQVEQESTEMAREAPAVTVHLHCSKGSFIRTWADQLGQKLGCGGVVAQLKRTISSPYSLQQAVELEQIQALIKNQMPSQDWGSFFVSMAQALPNFRSMTVRGRDERLLMGGQVSHDLSRRLIVEQKEATQTQKMVGIKILSAQNGALLSLLEAQPNRGLKIRRVFNLLG